MFRFLELELHGWDYWSSLRVPLDADVIVLSGPNGSGKTTMLDAIRQVLHAPKLSQNRKLPHYLRQPGRPALLRAVVSNHPDSRGRRPFERQRVLSDEATLACAIVPNGGAPEKRYVVLPGRVGASDLQGILLDTKGWMGPEEYRRVLDYAGVSRSLMHILALEQGRADELSRQRPRELFRWVMEARGSQQVLERYTGARRRYEDTVREVERQRAHVLRSQAELGKLERQVRRLEEHTEKQKRVLDAQIFQVASMLQAHLSELKDVEKKLPEARTKIANLLTTIDRLDRDIRSAALELDQLRSIAELRRAEVQAMLDASDKAAAVATTAKIQRELASAALENLQHIPFRDPSDARDRAGSCEIAGSREQGAPFRACRTSGGRTLAPR